MSLCFDMRYVHNQPINLRFLQGKRVVGKCRCPDKAQVPSNVHCLSDDWKRYCSSYPMAEGDWKMCSGLGCHRSSAQYPGCLVYMGEYTMTSHSLLLPSNKRYWVQRTVYRYLPSSKASWKRPRGKAPTNCGSSIARYQFRVRIWTNLHWTHHILTELLSSRWSSFQTISPEPSRTYPVIARAFACEGSVQHGY